MLEKYSVTELIDVIIGFEDVALPKPAPEGLLAAIRALGVSRGETLYIGDTVIDAKTAQSAGVDFAAVTTGTTPAEAFDGYPCVAVASGLSRLPPIISALE
jgi:phosphoglycolate phosphatase